MVPTSRVERMYSDKLSKYRNPSVCTVDARLATVRKKHGAEDAGRVQCGEVGRGCSPLR